MNAALSVILSLTTVLAGASAAFGDDLFSPHSVPADDCIVDDLCTDGGHGNETSEPENETAEPENGTADPDPEPEPEPGDDGNETDGHHHHYHNETQHHHHYHNGTADGNGTAEPEEDGPEDVYFCTTSLSLLGEDYSFGWPVEAGYETFTLDWHFQPLALGLISEPDVHVELLDGAGRVVYSGDGYDALHFSLETEDLRGYAPGDWLFTVTSSELVGDQGLVGHVEY